MKIKKYFILLSSLVTSMIIASENPFLTKALETLNKNHDTYTIQIEQLIEKGPGSIFIFNKHTQENCSIIPFYDTVQWIEWDHKDKNILHITFESESKLKLELK